MIISVMVGVLGCLVGLGDEGCSSRGGVEEIPHHIPPSSHPPSHTHIVNHEQQQQQHLVEYSA